MATERIYQRVHVAPIRLLQQSMSLMGDDYWMFLLITFVGMVIGSFVPLIIYGAMICGIYLCYLQRMRGKRADFETLFRGFDYFVESLIATLLVALASIALIAPCILLLIALAVGIAMSGQDAGPVAALVMLILIPIAILVSLVVSALFIFVYPLIVDKQYSAVSAITTSCRAVWANLGGILVAFVLYGVLNCVAALACGIGVLFFAPILFGAMTVLYRQIFPERSPVGMEFN